MIIIPKLEVLDAGIIKKWILAHGEWSHVLLL
jgi:hypothetical protein